MGMNLSEKILAQAAGADAVRAGEIVIADVDLCMTNDATTHISIDIFNKLKVKNLKDPSKIVFIMDHNVPAENITTAFVQKMMRDFALKHGIVLIEGQGICHQLMIEDYINPGQVVFAADSHTCSYGAFGAFGAGVGSTDLVGIMTQGNIWLMVPSTIKVDIMGKLNPFIMSKDLILRIISDLGSKGATYKALEFGGDGLSALSIDSRISICNMALEAGAKNAIMPPDQQLLDYLTLRNSNHNHNLDYKWLYADDDATYESTIKYDLSQLEPIVACPHTVSNAKPITKVAGISIDQAFLGSCANGRIEDLRIASQIIAGKKVHPNTRFIISPASNKVYRQALKEDLINIFLEAGAIVVNPNCSVCWGSCQGLVGRGETLVSTGTRNFKGRSGSTEADIYLASPATVTASAVKGVLTDPRENQ